MENNDMEKKKPYSDMVIFVAFIICWPLAVWMMWENS